jgi:hypothetical protein
MNRRHIGRRRPSRLDCEPLESRTLLAAVPADIRWVNAATTTTGGSADTDGFGATFGTLAPVARAVVHSIIDTYEVMIGSFNYASSSTFYSLTLSAGAPGTGFGGVSTLTAMSGTKPRAATVTIDGGDDDGIADSDNGWFIDPTPYDASEFLGAISNAFTGEAPFGSSAADRFDFHSVVAHEVAHAMGFTNTPAFAALTTDTGVADAQNGGIGRYFVFRGPSVKRLLTSYNNGADSGAAKHSAKAGAFVMFDNEAYTGAQDVMNPNYRKGTRLLVTNTLALMLKDAYGYDVNLPQAFGTFYAMFNQTTGELLVRGGDAHFTSNSHDVISLWWDGTDYNVSVNVSNDVQGTGPGPGAGDLGPFVSKFRPELVTHVTVNALGFDDNIFLDHAIKPVTISGSGGNDLITVGGGDYDANILSGVKIDGGTNFAGDPGLDILSIDDAQDDAGNDVHNARAGYYWKNGAAETRSEAVEAFRVIAGPQGDTFNVMSTDAAAGFFADGRGGNDTFVLGNPFLDQMLGPVNVVGGSGTDTVSIRDEGHFPPETYTLTNTTFARGDGRGSASWSQIERLALVAGFSGDTINLNFSSGSPPATISGGNGDDTIVVNSAGYTGAELQNAVSLTGAAGADTLRFNASPGSTTNLYNNSFDSTRTPTYLYFEPTIESFDFRGSAGADEFIVRSTRMDTATTVSGGDGADLIHVGGTPGAPYHMDDIDGPLVVNGQNGPDELALSDNGLTIARSYTLSANDLQRSGLAPLSFDDFEKLSLTGTAGPDTINVAETVPGALVSLDGGPGLDAVTVNSDGTGSARVQFDAAQDQDLDALAVFNGGVARLRQFGKEHVLTTRSLNVAPGGEFDIGDDAVIVDYPAGLPSPAAAIRAALVRGRNAGTWDGDGIVSINIDGGDPTRSIGHAESAAVFGAFPATFLGRPVDSSAVLLRLVGNGDANLDGSVNLVDFNRLANNFGTSNRVWSDGDFNYDGNVNLIDFNLLARNFGASFAAEAQGAALRPGAGPGAGPGPGAGARAGAGASGLLDELR